MSVVYKFNNGSWSIKPKEQVPQEPNVLIFTTEKSPTLSKTSADFIDNASFIKIWLSHSSTLTLERRISIDKALSLPQSIIRILNNFGFQNDKSWFPRTKKQIAMWNGNPFALFPEHSTKYLIDIYDKIEKIEFFLKSLGYQ